MRKILRAARAAYHALRPQDRPALDQPSNAAVLFALDELRQLSMAGIWPLSEMAIGWLAEPPAERRRRRLRFERRVAEVVRQVLAAELGPAVEALTRGRK